MKIFDINKQSGTDAKKDACPQLKLLFVSFFLFATFAFILWVSIAHDKLLCTKISRLANGCRKALLAADCLTLYTAF